MIANQLPTILQKAQGHAFQSDILAKHGVSVRSIKEMEEIIDELTGRPQAKSTTRPKPVSAELAAKRRAGRRAWAVTGRRAAFANN